MTTRSWQISGTDGYHAVEYEAGYWDGRRIVRLDGQEVANLGPGALIGERAVLEGGRRTATLVAVTPCKVAEARKVDLDMAKLAEVSAGHRREDAPS